jgi:catechol 2,3-dioxygenase-like lactoylglutathione lyase family enzyme
MTTETMIPCLPCHSINDTLDFYVALGFEITYQQSRPNNYLAVKRGGIELHFFTMKGFDPEGNYSTCIVITPDVEAAYTHYREALRRKYGKYPTSGSPRITRMHTRTDGGRGFNIVDVAGNWIRFAEIMEVEAREGTIPPGAETKLGYLLHTADVLLNSHGSPEKSAKVLDNALSQLAEGSPVEQFKVLVARANVAAIMEHPTLAQQILAQAQTISLSDEERAVLGDTLELMEEVEEMLVVPN